MIIQNLSLIAEWRIVKENAFVLSARIGKDGIIFENCKFDNGMLDTDTEQSVTFLGLEEQKEEKNRNRIKELLEKKRLKEQGES